VEEAGIVLRGLPILTLLLVKGTNTSRERKQEGLVRLKEAGRAKGWGEGGHHQRKSHERGRREGIGICTLYSFMNEVIRKNNIIP
jgi:hypothetical protein